MDILGISTLGGPASACLVRDGRVLAAVREDVLSGRAGDSGFPANAIAFCLRTGKIGAAQLDSVWVAGSLDTRLDGGAYPESAPGGSAFRRLARWFGRGRTLRDVLRAEIDGAREFRDVDATLAEAAAAALTSPHESAAVVVIEGERVTRARVESGTLRIQGSERWQGDLQGTAERWLRESGASSLALGGSGAQDRTLNGGLLRRGIRDLWIHPAAGGGAAALGAALLGWRDSGGAEIPKVPTALGPAYNASQIRTFLRSQGILPEEPGRDDAARQAAHLLAEGDRVAWMDGRLDFGEDTAGSRSVLRAPSPRHPADSAADEALAVAAERIPELFDLDGPCPAFVELQARPGWRERLGLAEAERPVPVSPVAAEHRGLRTLLAAFEQATGSPAVVARPLRRLGGAIAAAPHDVWAARGAERVAALALVPYLVTGTPLTEGHAPRESRALTSAPESTE